VPCGRPLIQGIVVDLQLVRVDVVGSRDLFGDRLHRARFRGTTTSSLAGGTRAGRCSPVTDGADQREGALVRSRTGAGPSSGRSGERGARRHTTDCTPARGLTAETKMGLSAGNDPARSRVRCVSVKVWSRPGAAPCDVGTVSSHRPPATLPRTFRRQSALPVPPSRASPHP